MTIFTPRMMLILIVLLAGLLRLVWLNIPGGLTVDEAGQGLSAYSLLKTGRDEWGDFFPLNPRGFGDYKPPVYSYLLIPSIAIFGLSDEAVRLPSAFLGTLTVLIIYFITKELFKNNSLALIAGFLLAVLPWHIYTSRIGWESNAALFFLSCGIWLFLKGLGKSHYLILSSLSFGIAALTYHSVKVLTPVIILILISIFWKELLKVKKKDLLVSSFLLAIFALIILYGFIFSGALRRASDQALSNPENLAPLRETQVEDRLPQPWGRVINSRFQFVASKFIENYLGYFSTSFLFSPHRSDSSILNFPGKGLLFIWELPLLVLGIWFLLNNKSKASLLIISFLLVAPIPASMSRDYMQAGRAQPLALPLVIILALGVTYLNKFLKNTPKPFSRAIILAFFTILIWSFVGRIDNYFFHTFNKQLGGLNQGYKEIVEFTENNKQKYNKIIFTKQNSEPHAYVAFYSKMDPTIVQKYSQDWKYFESEGIKYLDMIDYKLEKYEFRNFSWKEVSEEKDTLIVAHPRQVPESISPKLSVKNAKGDVVFVAIEPVLNQE